MQHRDDLDFRGLREHVERLDVRDAVAGFHAAAHVARERRRVAGDVDRPAGPEVAERGADAASAVARGIEEHRLDIRRRPQQLFLTGDQIYADDLSGCLLPQTNAIGRELLGFTETQTIDVAKT